MVVAVASALALTLLGPQASADELTTQRARVKQQIAKSKSELNESTKELSAAVVQVDKAQNKLDAATARLTTTRQELRVAQTKDAHMATKLKQARADLAAAVAAVVAGQARLDAQQAKAGQVVRDQYQQQTNLLPIALLVDPDSSEDFQTRLQWSTTLRPAQAEIDRLTLLQRQLNAARTQQAELEAKVAAARREAAANLKIKKGLEARAAAQESTVARLLRQRKTAEDAAAIDVAQDKARYSELIKERASVERRRCADRAAAERAAERAAAERKRAAERKARQRSRSATKQSHRLRQRQRSSNHSTMSSASHGFSLPVAAHITSPFGMRFHPVLRYWKLHDGTDFGAACGTPIRLGPVGSRSGTTTPAMATG